MPSSEGASFPRQAKMLSSKSAFTMITWVPFYFISVIIHNMRDNRWSRARMPRKDLRERICQRPQQTLLTSSTVRSDHVSFFISILLNLPQVSSPRAVSLEKRYPHHVDFTGRMAEGLGLQERAITHNFPLDFVEAGGASELEEEEDWKLCWWAGNNISAASAAGCNVSSSLSSEKRLHTSYYLRCDSTLFSTPATSPAWLPSTRNAASLNWDMLSAQGTRQTLKS